MWVDLPPFGLSMESQQQLVVYVPEGHDELVCAVNQPDEPEFFARISQVEVGKQQPLQQWLDDKLLLEKTLWPQGRPGGPKVVASRTLGDGWVAVLETVSQDNGLPQFVVCSQRALGGVTYLLEGLTWTAEAARRVAAALYSVRVRMSR